MSDSHSISVNKPIIFQIYCSFIPRMIENRKKGKNLQIINHYWVWFFSVIIIRIPYTHIYDVRASHVSIENMAVSLSCLNSHWLPFPSATLMLFWFGHWDKHILKKEMGEVRGRWGVNKIGSFENEKKIVRIRT